MGRFGKLLGLEPAAQLVEFCERCGCLCDRGCRAQALRDRSLERAFRLGRHLS